MSQHVAKRSSDVARIAEKHGIDRPCRGGHDAHGDQGVHGGDPMPRVSDRRFVERPGGPGQNRCRQGQQDPLPTWEAQRRNDPEGDGGIAERHEQETRHNEPPSEIADPAVRLGFGGGVGSRGEVIDDLGGEPRRLDAFDEDSGGSPRRHSNPGPLGRQVDLRFDAVERIEPPLDPSHTGAAGHSSDGERYLVYPRWGRPGQWGSRSTQRVCRDDESLASSVVFWRATRYMYYKS